MTNNVGITSSVGDTTLQFTISIDQRQFELVKLKYRIYCSYCFRKI